MQSETHKPEARGRPGDAPATIASGVPPARSTSGDVDDVLVVVSVHEHPAYPVGGGHAGHHAQGAVLAPDAASVVAVLASSDARPVALFPGGDIDDDNETKENQYYRLVHNSSIK